MKRFLSWLKYRKLRKEQAARAASLAVQLVMSGSLAPPRFTGIGFGQSPRNCVIVSATKVLVRREGWA
jgi:hypothetical protein